MMKKIVIAVVVLLIIFEGFLMYITIEKKDEVKETKTETTQEVKTNENVASVEAKDNVQVAETKENVVANVAKNGIKKLNLSNVKYRIKNDIILVDGDQIHSLVHFADDKDGKKVKSTETPRYTMDSIRKVDDKEIYVIRKHLNGIDTHGTIDEVIVYNGKEIPYTVQTSGLEGGKLEDSFDTELYTFGDKYLLYKKQDVVSGKYSETSSERKAYLATKVELYNLETEKTIDLNEKVNMPTIASVKIIDKNIVITCADFVEQKSGDYIKSANVEKTLNLDELISKLKK